MVHFCQVEKTGQVACVYAEPPILIQGLKDDGYLHCPCSLSSWILSFKSDLNRTALQKKDWQQRWA